MISGCSMAERMLVAMAWEGNAYVDPMLPFGLHSAPKVFNALLMCWSGNWAREVSATYSTTCTISSS